MNPAKPPIAATWLLKRFCSGRQSQGLIGDLSEEYQKGRSIFWYWRQVLIAIVVSFCGEIRSHGLLAMRAVSIGWGVWFLYQSFLALPLLHLVRPLSYRFPPFFGSYFQGGLIWWIIWLSVRAFSGWLVARLHRPHQTAMVLAFALSVALWKAQGISWFINVEWVGSATYLLPVIFQFTYIFLPPIFILLGGLYGSRDDREHSRQSVHIAG